MKNEDVALIKILQRIILEIRLLGYEGQNEGLSKERSALIADLADAIHNIPEALLSEEYDLNFHTEVMLGGFDEKYKEASCAKLLVLYKSYLNESEAEL